MWIIAQVACAPYSASNTNFGKNNATICNIYACPGTSIVMSGCGNGNGDQLSNDQYLSFWNSTGAKLAISDDGCPDGAVTSRISYVVDQHQGCQNFILVEACYDFNSCFGCSLWLVLLIVPQACFCQWCCWPKGLFSYIYPRWRQLSGRTILHHNLSEHSNW